MHKKLIVANWKMNPWEYRRAKDLYAKTKSIAAKCKKIHTVICPPFVYLGAFSALKKSSTVSLGGQDCFYKQEGSHTGEVAPLMLAGVGARYVIVGHSERRSAGEDNEEVSAKLRAGLQAGLHVILCVGESHRDEDGKYLAFIRDQIGTALSGVHEKDVPRVVVAYEPLWAIGQQARRAATPSDVLEMKIFLRKVLTDMYSKRSVSDVAVLYGGSVDEKNAMSFLEQGEVDGLLIGRASLDEKVFKEILIEANQIKK